MGRTSTSSCKNAQNKKKIEVKTPLKKLTVKEFVISSRKKMLDKLNEEAEKLDNEEIQHLITSTQALIEANNESWEQLKNFLVNDKVQKFRENYEYHDSGGKLASRGYHENEKNSSFYRHGYFIVEVETMETEDENEDEDNLDVKIFDATQFCCFDIPEVPTLLIEILSKPNNMIDDAYPNYMDYLAKMMILQDDIQKPVLKILKEHLKQIQLCFGKIESWILEGFQTTIFFDDLLDRKLDRKLPVPMPNFICEGNYDGMFLKDKYLWKGDGVYVDSFSIPKGFTWNGQLFDVMDASEKEKLRKLISFVKK